MPIHACPKANNMNTYVCTQDMGSGNLHLILNVTACVHVHVSKNPFPSSFLPSLSLGWVHNVRRGYWATGSNGRRRSTATAVREKQWRRSRRRRNYCRHHWQGWWVYIMYMYVYIIFVCLIPGGTICKAWKHDHTVTDFISSLYPDMHVYPTCTCSSRRPCVCDMCMYICICSMDPTLFIQTYMYTYSVEGLFSRTCMKDLI